MPTADELDWERVRALILAAITLSDDEKVSVLIAALDRAHAHGAALLDERTRERDEARAVLRTLDLHAEKLAEHLALTQAEVKAWRAKAKPCEWCGAETLGHDCETMSDDDPIPAARAATDAAGALGTEGA